MAVDNSFFFRPSSWHFEQQTAAQVYINIGKLRTSVGAAPFSSESLHTRDLVQH